MIDMVKLNKKIYSPASAIAILVLFALVVLLIQSCTGISSQPVWDEDYMYAQNQVVQNIVAGNWSVKSMLDYEDTKGPVFFWVYAGWAELFGSDLDSLRFLSKIIFTLSAIPFVILARYAGLAGWRLLSAGILFVLLPDLIVLSQLFMSETLFIFSALWLLVIFLKGLDSRRNTIKYLIFYTIILALMLHIRIHAIVYAGAIVLVAFKREGFKSWPWWLASFIAGLSRIPLWLRWDGLVSPAFQDRYGLGFRLDSLTYLIIALLPCTAAMLCAFLCNKSNKHKRNYMFIAAGAICGLALGLFACPDITRQAGANGSRFLGPVATALQPLLDKPILLKLTIAFLAAIGSAALSGMILPCFINNRNASSDRSVCVEQICVLMVALGWLMYAFTSGDVFDRYVLISIILLPLVWVKHLPGWLLTIEFAGLFILLLLKIYTWLEPAVSQIQ